MKLRILGLACLWIGVAGCTSDTPIVGGPNGSVESGLTDFTVKRDGVSILTYHTAPPAGVSLSVETGGFFHPFLTPAGERVTDLAPEDHRHHRGIFLGWVEMHGAKDADFWGWGQHAPTKGRRIENRALSGNTQGLVAENEWLADNVVLLDERMESTVSEQGSIRILDLQYQLTARADVTLSRWAFSGFCLRGRKDGSVAFYSPAGLATLPNPVHTKPESDWPDAAWYAWEQRLENGKVIGAGVIQHPGNPPTLWHNHRDIRMINPCIVAPGAVVLKAGKPMALRYRVVAFDGELKARQLDRLAAEFRSKP